MAFKHTARIWSDPRFYSASKAQARLSVDERAFYAFMLRVLRDPQFRSIPFRWGSPFLGLLSLRQDGELPCLDDAQVASALQMTPKECAETKAALVQLGLIDEAWDIVEWERYREEVAAAYGEVQGHRAPQQEEQGREGTV